MEYLLFLKGLSLGYQILFAYILAYGIISGLMNVWLSCKAPFGKKYTINGYILADVLDIIWVSCIIVFILIT